MQASIEHCIDKYTWEGPKHGSANQFVQSKSEESLHRLGKVGSPFPMSELAEILQLGDGEQISGQMDELLVGRLVDGSVLEGRDFETLEERQLRRG